LLSWKLQTDEPLESHGGDITSPVPQQLRKPYYSGLIGFEGVRDVEFLKVLAGWTAIIVVLCVPVVLVAGLYKLGASGLFQFLHEVRVGSWDRAVWGLAALILAAAAGWLAFRLVNPPPPEPLQVTVAEPRAKWVGALPDLILVYDPAFAPAAFMSGGRRVIVAEPPYGEKQWRAVEAKQTPFCQKVLRSADYVIDKVGCLELKPTFDYSPANLGPHFAVEKSGGIETNRSVIASVYLVDRQQRQLVALCRGKMDAYRPQLAWLGLGVGNANARALNICLRQAIIALPDMIHQS